MKNRQEAYGDRTPCSCEPTTLTDMRGAFVVRLRPGEELTPRRFEGWAEEVDTGKRLNFRSGIELLRFLAESFDETLRREQENR